MEDKRFRTRLWVSVAVFSGVALGVIVNELARGSQLGGRPYVHYVDQNTSFWDTHDPNTVFIEVVTILAIAAVAGLVWAVRRRLAVDAQSATGAHVATPTVAAA
ncbi:MAG: hypothetical protein LBM94_00590 [Propionibacteriaceae bacterium]|jgi:hypothetical protein|nr:hypothetical protein [Propionibacteriaceae bacterium]